MCLQYKSVKTLCAKEKLLILSNFSFSPVFSTPLEFYHFHQIQNCHLQNLSVWKRKGKAFVDNYLPDDRIFTMSDLKAFAGKLNATKKKNRKKIRFVFHWVKNTVRKGENVGHQHFLFFPHNVFKMLIPLGHKKKSSFFGKGLIVYVLLNPLPQNPDF